MLFALLVMVVFDPLHLLCQFTLFYRSVHNVHAFGSPIELLYIYIGYLGLIVHVSVSILISIKMKYFIHFIYINTYCCVK